MTSSTPDQGHPSAIPVAEPGPLARAADPGRTGAGTLQPAPEGASQASPTSLPLPPTAPSAAAGMPEPVTGAALSSRAAPGRAQAPAGAARAVLAGSNPTGREVYDQARRKARARRPADPQQAPGRPGAPARVAEMMRPCATALPGGGVCGATGLEHDIGTRGGAEVRTRCSIATAAGACGCRAYVPQPEAQDGAA